MRPLCLLAPLALLASALISPAVADGTDADSIASLNAFNDRFNDIVAERDVEGFVSLYREDTVWIAQQDRPVQGDREPRALIEFIAGNEGELTHTVDNLFVSDDGSLAVMIGTADVLVEKVGMEAQGVYLFVLEKDQESWKIATDMWHQFAPQ